MQYTKDDLPTDGWSEYRKVDTTRMVSITGPCTVMTREGQYYLPVGWVGFLALDSGGWPYPVDSQEHAESYERVTR